LLSTLITELEVASTYVSPRTTWRFLRLTTSDGSAGLGELTSADPAVLDAELRALRSALTGADAAGDRAGTVAALHERAVAERDKTRRHALAVLASGLDAAWADLLARAAGVPLWQQLGGRALGQVSLYANINRGLWTRTPEEFATRAAEAVAAGFTRVKCAPFDHLPLTGADLREAGLERLAAVRDAIGPDIDLYVDAHAKLPPDETLRALPNFERLRIGWLEDAVPLPRIDLLREVRAATGLRLAGGEQAYTAADLLPALDASVFDAVLLDVRYTGGFTALGRLIDMVSERGLPVTLHNPAGPVATAASLHATTLIPVPTVLEFAYGETSWRPVVLSPPESVSAGQVSLPTTPGIGADVAEAFAGFGPVEEFAAHAR
jgi:galactonate dehydratase